MKLIDLFNNSNLHLFEEINKIKPLPTLVNSTQLDVTFLLSHSEKLLTKKVISMVENMGEEDTILSLANTLSFLFSDKWNLQNDLFSDSFTGQKRTIIETINDDGKNTLNGTDTNKKSAYDSENFVNDSQTEEQSKNEITNERTREFEENVKYSSQVSSTIKNLQNNQLSNIIMLDVIETICKLIY